VELHLEIPAPTCQEPCQISLSGQEAFFFIICHDLE